MNKVLRLLLVVVGVTCASPPAHAGDWLDDMPSVERVALVAHQDGAMTQDAQATLIATILILLRQAIAYRAAIDTDMTPQRQAKLRRIDATYQQVEFAIGNGLGKRSGGLDAAQARQYYESRRYEPCETRQCYDYWLKAQLEWWGAAKLRDRLMPLLVPCDLAKELVELVARHALSAPLVPKTPALTHMMDESVRAVAESSPAETCNTFMGRDVDGDGLCSGWEARLYDVKPGNPIRNSCDCTEPDQGYLACDEHRHYEPDTRHKLQVDNPRVRVETGVRWTNAIPPGECGQDGPPVAIPDGITITVKNCPRNPRVVQYINREQRLQDNSLEAGTYEKDTGCPGTSKPLLLSLSDVNGPAWHLDGTPYYNSYYMPCDTKAVDSMTIFDAPSFRREPFDPVKYRYWRANFVSFVLCDGEVVSEIRWTRTLQADARGTLVNTFNVDPNVMPDMDDVRKFQCLSEPQWASCSVMLHGPVCGQ